MRKHHKKRNEINGLGDVETTPSLAGRLRRPRKTGLAEITEDTPWEIKKPWLVWPPILVRRLVKRNITEVAK